VQCHAKGSGTWKNTGKIKQASNRLLAVFHKALGLMMLLKM
jgi:hypothetical protein